MVSTHHKTPRLVLASASPRRQALIPLLRLDARAAPQALDEEQFLLHDPLLSAVAVALAKARAVQEARPEEVVLGADSIVVADGRLLGKPRDEADARGMLERLRGRAHSVLTGVALRRTDGCEWSAAVETRVVMRAYGPDEVDAYVARGESFDKAGAYAVQDALFRPVERLDGCYLNVVGLPLCAIARGLETLGVPPPTDAAGPLVPPCRYCQHGARLVSIAPPSAPLAGGS